MGKLCEHLNVVYINIFLDDQFNLEEDKNKHYVNKTTDGWVGSFNGRSHTENTNVPL